MKPAAFEYARPRSLAEAVGLLAGRADAKLMAGAQTLGPMLNLRLVRPGLVIDITRIPELARVESDTDAVTLGACVTHAAIEDGRIDDPTAGFLSTVARGIAYRAVRNRGTIGGSLAHADPAADWLSCLVGLEAAVWLTGPRGRRRLALGEFVRGAMTTELGEGEIIDGIRIPRAAPGRRAGYAKICRKTGEFAEAIGFALHDPDRRVFRLVAGATQSRPFLFESAADTPAETGPEALRASLVEAGFAGDAYELAIQAAALRRAIDKARAA